MVGRREGSGKEFVGKVSEFGISSQFTPCLRCLSGKPLSGEMSIEG